MTIKIKNLREPPLLSPPMPDEDWRKDVRKDAADMNGDVERFRARSWQVSLRPCITS
jgi:hypothetical protein